MTIALIAGFTASIRSRCAVTTSRADGRLPLQDLGSIEFKPTLQATAAVHLGITTTKPDSASSALPSFAADVNIDAGITWNGSGSPTVNSSIKFQNVSVDVGSFMSTFLKPVAKELHKFTQPLEKPIEAIQSPIPGVADAVATCCVPLQGGYGLPFNVIGRANTDGPFTGGGGIVFTSPGYFATFEIPVLRGRAITGFNRETVCLSPGERPTLPAT